MYFGPERGDEGSMMIVDEYSVEGSSEKEEGNVAEDIFSLETFQVVKEST
jgi:hypothetical protein